MAKDAFKEKLTRIETLRHEGDLEILVVGLRKALTDRNSYALSKAAAIAGSRNVLEIVPDLIASYDRLFNDEPKIDPLALGKQTIAQALKDLDHRDPAVFVRGLQHIQMEPVWGGSADVAGDLRATCAHALVGCDIEAATLLELFVDRLVDTNKTVRIEVVRAIAQMGGYESALLLRLKALSGDTDAEVFGAIFDALLGMQNTAITFVERFLRNENAEIAIEAASALAASRVYEAFTSVQRLWDAPISREMRHAIVLSSGASRLVEAGEFLLSVVSEPRTDLAAAALSALAASRFRTEFRDRARVAAEQTGNARIVAAYSREFPPEAAVD